MDSARLGQALGEAEADKTATPWIIAAIRLLIPTGARLGEIVTLKWEHVDFERQRLRLADSKMGTKSIYLEVLKELPRFTDKAFVFPAVRGNGLYEGTPKVWRRIRATAGLDDVRLHDLRHSFASIAVSRGASLPIIGALLGHSSNTTTQRYAHLHDDPLKSATEAVGREIAASLDDGGTEDIAYSPPLSNITFKTR
ncbi:MAG: site-specific integrase [Hyphomicrobiaceae bacterium]